MPNIIKPKRSSVPAKVPLTTDLQVGELAVNLADKKIYTKDGSDAVVVLSSDADTVDGLHGTQFVRNYTSGTIIGNLTVGDVTTATNRVVKVLAPDTHNAGFEAHGNSQGTGYVYVGQGNNTFGGGIFYNGDVNPTFAVGEFADRISFYKTRNGTREVLFSNFVDNSLNTVDFRGPISLGTANHTNAEGRGLLLEKVTDSTGESSSRIFFNESSGGMYGISLYFEGSPNSVLPSGMQPNAGDGAWSLRRHDNNLNGVPIMSGNRTSNDVAFAAAIQTTAVQFAGHARVGAGSVTYTSTSQQVFLSLTTTSYGSFKVLLQATRGTERHVTELLGVHDGTTAHATEYGTIMTGSSLFSADVDISGGSVRLLLTPTSATSTTIRGYLTYLVA